MLQRVREYGNETRIVRWLTRKVGISLRADGRGSYTKWARMGRARASIVSAIVLRDSQPLFAPRLSHVSRQVPALDAKNFDALVLGELLADRRPGKVGLSAHRAYGEAICSGSCMTCTALLRSQLRK